MRQSALQHIVDDLHIVVSVHRKSSAGLDRIVVDDAQCTELNISWIVIIPKGKAVPGIQPAIIGMAAILARRNSIWCFPLSVQSVLQAMAACRANHLRSIFLQLL